MAKRIIKARPQPPPEWRPSKHAPVYLYGCHDTDDELVVRVVAPAEDVVLGKRVPLTSYDLLGVSLKFVSAEVITAAQLPPEAITSTAKCGLKITAGKLVGTGLKAKIDLRDRKQSKAN
ncbi:MAG: hypothetical protein QOE70_399 [Chthoniobacter sp.]|jgi:hypothetical protein|nr:hypothetical protein [Chthoniobacter sp.]